MGVNIYFFNKDGDEVDSTRMMRTSKFFYELFESMEENGYDEDIVEYNDDNYYTGKYAKVTYDFCKKRGVCEHGNIPIEVIYAMHTWW